MKTWQKGIIVSLAFIIGLVIGLILPTRLLTVLSSSTTLIIDRDTWTGNTYTAYGKSFNLGSIDYSISYTDVGKVRVTGTFSNSTFDETFPAELNSKFTVFGMEGVISEVHNGYIIVSVRPL